MKLKNILIAGCVTVAVTAAFADSYYWVNNDANSWHSWSDPANWTDASGNPVASAPGAADTLASTNLQVKGFFDFGGAGMTNCLSAFTITHSSWWLYDKFGLTNGTLVVSGTANFESPSTVDIWKDGTLCVSNLTFSNKNTGESNMDQFVVHDGGRFEVLKNFQPRQVKLTVEAGGTFYYPASAYLQNCNNQCSFDIFNSGTLNWPGGFWRHDGAWSVHPYVRQLGGRWSLGDKIEMPNNITFRIELTGGNLKATGDVTFRLYGSDAISLFENGQVWAKFMPQADITLEVAAGKTLDMVRSDSRYVPFTYEPDEDGTNYTAITRTGEGTLLLPDVPYSLDLQSGTTTFSANTRRAMGTLKVAAGQSLSFVNADTTLETISNAGTITLAAPGLSVGGIAAGGDVASGTFAIDLTAFSEGDTIVSTADAVLRAKIKADLAPVLDNAGKGIVESGNTLTIGGATYVFDSTTVTDLNDPAGWQNGLPVAGKDVIITGSGVRAIVTEDLTNIWNSIAVQGGASLQIAAVGLTLPGLILEGDAALAVAADSAVASLTTRAKDGAIPTATVGAGAKLTVPAGYRFQDVNLVLADGSTLTGSGDGPLVFGYAAAGKTTSFALHATNATITALNAAGAENGSRIDFASPAAGGAVGVIGDIVLKGCTISYTGKDGFAFGLNNPTDRTFRVIADATPLNIANTTAIAGAANLVLTNGSVLFRKRYTIGQHGYDTPNVYNITVSERGKVTLVAGGEIRATVTIANADDSNGYFGLGAVVLMPSETGFAGIEVLEGGIGCWWKTYGDNTGVIRYAGGKQKVFQGHWWGSVKGGNRNRIFNRLKDVEIVKGSTLLLEGFQDSFGDNDPALKPFYIDSPFTGSGDFVVTNTWNGKTCEPRFESPKNTCTGTLRAADCAGTAKAVLCFVDGANWAGTVVADGKVKYEDETVPSRHSFGALDLRADYPIKVWKTDGAVTTNDVLNIGNYINNGGKLVPALVEESGEFGATDAFVLGRIAKNATLPEVAFGWEALTRVIPGDDANDELIIKRRRGFILLMR